MIDKESAAAFLDELGDVVNKHKAKGLSAGVLIGALEVVKLTIFKESTELIDKQKQPEEQGWSMES